MEIRKTVLVPHPAESMFDLIEAAEHYPAFVAGCRAAQIVERSDEVVAARLTLRQAGLSFELETRNPKRRPHWMAIHLTRGPFRHFQGEWRLTPLNATACRIDFTLSYELDGVVGRVAAPVFARIADNLVDAFVERAARVLRPAPELTPAESPTSTARSDSPVSALPAAPAATPTHDHTTEPHAMDTLKPDTAFLIDTLRASKLGIELTDGQLARLAALVTLHHANEGDVLVPDGTSDSHLYLLVKGALGAVKNAGSAERVTLSTLSAGDIAGELSFMDGQKRYASLMALSDATVIGLSRESLEGVLESDPWLVYRVMRNILRSTHQLQYRLSMQQAELSNYIYKQHGRY